MTEETDITLEHAKNYVIERNIFWKKIDEWIDDDPGRWCQQFASVKSAMLLHCEYTSIVIKRVGYMKATRSGENNLTKEYDDFMNYADSTLLVSGNNDAPPPSIFEVLTELYTAVPEYTKETGLILNHLREHLSLILQSDMGWNQLTFSVDKFRSIYWQLCYTLRIIHPPADKEEGYDENRPKLRFSAFVTAILVAIWNDHEFTLSSKFSDYDKVATIPEYFNMLISSSQFRSLAQFFMIGLWLILQYRGEGGYITDTPLRVYSEQRAEEDKQEKRISNPSFNFVPEIDEETVDEIQREWEVFAVNLLKRGLLKAPEGFRIVQKGGRPRKYPLGSNRKRKSDDQGITEVSNNTPQNSGRFTKKEKISKTSPRKALKEPRKSFKREKNQPPRELFITRTTTSSVRKVVVKKVIPKPEDVGLCPPVYFMQSDILKMFEAEIERRQIEGITQESRERTRKYLFEAYDKIHTVARLTAEAPVKSLTVDQKQVMGHYKHSWRRGDSYDGAVEIEEEIEEETVLKEVIPDSRQPKKQQRGHRKSGRGGIR